MLKRVDNVVMRSIHGSFFLIDITDNYSGDKCALFEINETGKFLWEKLEKKCEKANLVTELQKAIVDEVPEEVLKEDVDEFVEELARMKFVVEAD